MLLHCIVLYVIVLYCIVLYLLIYFLSPGVGKFVVNLPMITTQDSHRTATMGRRFIYLFKNIFQEGNTIQAALLNYNVALINTIKKRFAKSPSNKEKKRCYMYIITVHKGSCMSIMHIFLFH